MTTVCFMQLEQTQMAEIFSCDMGKLRDVRGTPLVLLSRRQQSRYHANIGHLIVFCSGLALIIAGFTHLCEFSCGPTRMDRFEQEHGHPHPPSSHQSLMVKVDASQFDLIYIY
jgi:hypothetical protein